MKSKKLGLFLTLALVLTSVFAFAQDAPKEEESPIKISGSANFFYTVDAGYWNKGTAANALYQNYFMFDKLYLEFDHQMGKNFKYHVTLDAVANQVDAQAVQTRGYWVATTGPSAKAFEIPFIREAYATLSLGDAELFKVDVNLGLIPTKIIRYRGYMSDMRWLESMMFNGNYQIIGAHYLGKRLSLATTTGSAAQGGTSLGDGDCAQDMGVGIDLSFMKFLNFSFAVTAGEGVTQVTNDITGINGGKALYYDLLVVPMKGLFIHAFLRDETIQMMNSLAGSNNKTQKWFAGAGVGIKLMGINLGADFESGQQITSFEGQTAAGTGITPAVNFFALNAWLNWNLQEIAGFPLLVLGKISYGSYTDYSVAAYNQAAGVANSGKIFDTFHWYAGLGWQFNKNFKVAVIFEQYVWGDAQIYQTVYSANPLNDAAMTAAKALNSGWNNADSKLYVKTESKF